LVWNAEQAQRLATKAAGERVVKAFRIHQYGASGYGVLDEVPRPKVGGNDVLVRVEAASINPLDVKIMSGLFRERVPFEVPYTMGIDLAGEVVEAGRLVVLWQPGDKVVARLEPFPGHGTDFSRTGAFAEYVAVPARHLTFAPSRLTPAEVAGLPTAAGTAWQALVEVAGLEPGQTVLIHAGSGGVGSFAIQIAKLIGAEVIATTSTANVELVRELGADRVIDYKAEDFSALLRNIDLVFDTVGPEVQAKSYAVFKKGGLLASITAPPDEETAKARGVRAVRVSHMSDSGRLSLIAGQCECGNLRVLIDSTFSLSEIPAAIARSASGRARGKIVVLMN
jgi:NADPH:quinone reductase-like Zn-dependent oxidoreductase